MLPRVVLITRPTEYETLLGRHATHSQAAFFLEQRGQDIAAVLQRHDAVKSAVAEVQRGIPTKWRRGHIDRADLSRFVFEPDDLVVPVGQDGLVANVAKYLTGQLVIGVNPDPHLYDGVLVPHPAGRAPHLFELAITRKVSVEERTMVEARLDDGQRLLALNEVFLGHRSHQSARYRVRAGGSEERQSSSGIIVSTGTGATGWARSISLGRVDPPRLPSATQRTLAWFVREAFPSVATGTTITSGSISGASALEVISEMGDGGAIFGDGIEDDRLDFGWGMRATVRVADERLHLART
jgi:NAD kinase